MLPQDIRYIGVNDRTVDLFEGQYVVPNGMSYNSYVILDEKIAVMDTVDKDFGTEWLQKLADALQGRQPDYLIVQHMEPDHSANMARFLETYPQTTLVASAKALAMAADFYGVTDVATLPIREGDTLSLGRHQLRFVAAPMVHWPEVMLTYDETDRVLFSADAFGKFGTPDTVENWDDEARRYYIGIVGKYGAPVQTLLKKAATLDIAVICPLHGPVLSENLAHYVQLYDTWSSYRPEAGGVLVAYASVYGHTREAAEYLAARLREAGETVVVHDLARGDMAEAVAQAFRLDRLVLASPTYNADVFPFMRHFLDALTERGYQNRTVALIENGAWAPTAAKRMRQLLESAKDLTWLPDVVTVRAALAADSRAALDAMATALTSGKTM